MPGCEAAPLRAARRACVPPPTSPLPLPPPAHPQQHVLGEDLKASDIEVGLASAADGGRFRVLAKAELEEHLVAISERD